MVSLMFLMSDGLCCFRLTWHLSTAACVSSCQRQGNNVTTIHPIYDICQALAPTLHMTPSQITQCQNLRLLKKKKKMWSSHWATLTFKYALTSTWWEKPFKRDCDNIFLTTRLPSNDLRSIYILRSVGNLFNKVIYLWKSLFRVGVGTASEQSCQSADLYLYIWPDTAQKYSDVDLSVTRTPCKVWWTIWNWQMLR